MRFKQQIQLHTHQTLCVPPKMTARVSLWKGRRAVDEEWAAAVGSLRDWEREVCVFGGFAHRLNADERDGPTRAIILLYSQSCAKLQQLHTIFIGIW